MQCRRAISLPRQSRAPLSLRSPRTTSSKRCSLPRSWLDNAKIVNHNIFDSQVRFFSTTEVPFYEIERLETKTLSGTKKFILIAIIWLVRYSHCHLQTYCRPTRHPCLSSSAECCLSSPWWLHRQLDLWALHDAVSCFSGIHLPRAFLQGNRPVGRTNTSYSDCFLLGE